MAATLRYTDVPCKHCQGTGWGAWHTAHGQCFRCGPQFTKEAARKWFGVTLEWEGRMFKAVVHSYDEEAAREDAADLQLCYLQLEELTHVKGERYGDDAARGIQSRWAHAVPHTVVKIDRKVVDRFVRNNEGGRNVREVTKVAA